ncbi:hypothetical protein DAI22_12g196400 [Oryza sativa Japonica Group]|nr:hypothetical protein DAI22_12g196400 [Oryza sativa Japonica Group]
MAPRYFCGTGAGTVVAVLTHDISKVGVAMFFRCPVATADELLPDLAVMLTSIL